MELFTPLPKTATAETHDPQPELSIILPAYNEGNRIATTLQTLREYLHSSRQEWRGTEVIVVCDGCSDNTEALVRQAKIPEIRIISYARNRGKGHAVKTGILSSRGEVVVFADADGATPFREISRLAPLVKNGTDMVVGSRRLPNAKVVGRQPWSRQVLGFFFAKASHYILGLDFADTQCGFKLFQGTIARRLFGELQCPGFAFDLELLVLGRKQNLHIAETGVEWEDQQGSTVSPLRDGLRMLLTMLTLRRQFDKKETPATIRPIIDRTEPAS